MANHQRGHLTVPLHCADRFNGQAWTGPGFPWSDHGLLALSDQHGRWFPHNDTTTAQDVRVDSTEVSVADLWATQRRVFRKHLADLGARREGHGPVIVVRYTGRLWLWDGHHRAAVARSIGATTLRAQVFDLDEALTGPVDLVERILEEGELVEVRAAGSGPRRRLVDVQVAGGTHTVLVTRLGASLHGGDGERRLTGNQAARFYARFLGRAVA